MALAEREHLVEELRSRISKYFKEKTRKTVLITREEWEAFDDALSSAECVIGQVAEDTFGRRMTVKEFADASSYDS